MSENIIPPKGSTDVFGVSVLKRTQSINKEQTSVSFAVETTRKADVVAAPPNTPTRLSKTFSLHILVQEDFQHLDDDDKSTSINLNTGTGSKDNTNATLPPIEELEKRRFGQKDYPTIIKDNAVAPNNPLSFAPFAESC